MLLHCSGCYIAVNVATAIPESSEVPETEVQEVNGV
jgi:hypothetical protein